MKILALALLLAGCAEHAHPNFEINTVHHPQNAIGLQEIMELEPTR